MNLSERASYDQSVSLLDNRLQDEYGWANNLGDFSLIDHRPISAPPASLPTSKPSFQALII